MKRSLGIFVATMMVVALVMTAIAGTVVSGKDGEGCTPGYWKNHVDSWVGYTTGQDFDTVFEVDLFDPDITLLAALKAKGGGFNALARHAVAALLNAKADMNYEYSETEVIGMVKGAAASGEPGEPEATKDDFAIQNELGCPLD